MPLLIQLCIVVSTAAVVAIAIATVRTMVKVDRAATELNRTLRLVRRKVEDTSEGVMNVVASVEGMLPHVERVMSKFESVGERTARLSHTVLDEIEAPIRTAAALVKGIRSGSSQLVRSIRDRAVLKRAPSNGGIS